MKNRSGLIWFLALMALCVPSFGSQIAGADAATEIRMATLAPSGSSWMKIFDAWNRSLQKETNNSVKLRFYPGGSQGDEKDFVRKMRAGQMDGSAITVTGLSLIVRPVLVLAVPGLLTEYEDLDKVRTSLDKTFGKLFEDAGYILLGWGDAGKSRFFSVNKFEKPSDLKSMRPWAWKDDLIVPEFYRIVGVNGVGLGVPEVYPALQTKMIDALPASALAAVSLQWYTRLKYVTKDSIGVIVGAAVMRKEKFNQLTPSQQQALLSTGKRAHAALNKIIRADDDKAYNSILSRGIQEISIDAHRAEWEKALNQVRDNLAGRVYSKALLEQVQQAAGKK